MNPWEMEKWRGKHISNETRKGVYMRSDAGVDEDVRGACKRFLQWMRRNYEFPVRVVIYLKKYERIRASDGDLCTGIFYEPLEQRGIIKRHCKAEGETMPWLVYYLQSPMS